MGVMFQNGHRLWPVLFLCLMGCGSKPERKSVNLFTGQTMGTTYMVKVVGEDLPGLNSVPGDIQAELDRVNAAMSTWEATSDLSRFNDHDSVEPIVIAEMTRDVMANALAMAARTGGALDPTVGPLVELWGFGKQRTVTKPADDAIQRLLTSLGYEKLTLGTNEEGQPTLAKANPAMAVNLNANAKGYAVDRVAALLADRGYTNFMVEVGGEIAVRGGGPYGTGWRLAIADPEGELGEGYYTVVSPQGKAMATSGNYRNFFVLDGVTYHHVIDPRTGMPARDRVVAATVLAADCMTADALATALMVLEPQAGLALINSMPTVECLLLLKPDTAGEPLVEMQSTNFADYRLAE